MINFFTPQLLRQPPRQKTTPTLFSSIAPISLLETDPGPPEPDMEAYFLGLTKRHFLKHGRKITKEKYYAAWVQSMAATFNSYNINQQSFLNQLL